MDVKGLSNNDERWLGRQLDDPADSAASAVKLARLAASVEADLQRIGTLLEVEPDQGVLSNARAVVWNAHRRRGSLQRRLAAFGSVAAMLMIALGLWMAPTPARAYGPGDLVNDWIASAIALSNDQSELATIESELDLLEAEFPNGDGSLDDVSSELDELEADLEDWEDSIGET